MKIEYVSKNFTGKSLDLLSTIDTILESYAAQGYDLSVRQVYYQLVARDFIPNTQRSYKNIASLINDGRLAGFLDWDMIVDRGRHMIYPPHWDNPAQIVRAAAEQFRVDRWLGQSWHVEVMVEKQALEGVLEPVCNREDVRFTANKGYVSQSIMYLAAERIARAVKQGKDCAIIYLGDHDPSGLDMDRDLADRYNVFLWGNSDVEVERIALTWDQIEQYQPPENPAKTTDSRYRAYIAQFGGSSWELDALEPSVLADLVTRAIRSYRDDHLWDDAIKVEKQMRRELTKFAKEYEERNATDNPEDPA